jgi:hypothetical protein
VAAKVGSKGITTAATVGSKGLSAAATAGSKGLSAAGRLMIMTRESESSKSQVDLAHSVQSLMANRNCSSQVDLRSSAATMRPSGSTTMPKKRTLSFEKLMAPFRKKTSSEDLLVLSNSTSSGRLRMLDRGSAANASWGVYTDTWTTIGETDLSGNPSSLSSSSYSSSPRKLPNTILETMLDQDMGGKCRPIIPTSSSISSQCSLERQSFILGESKHAATTTGSGHHGTVVHAPPPRTPSQVLSLAFFRKRTNEDDDDDDDSKNDHDETATIHDDTSDATTTTRTTTTMTNNDTATLGVSAEQAPATPTSTLSKTSHSDVGLDVTPPSKLAAASPERPLLQRASSPSNSSSTPNGSFRFARKCFSIMDLRNKAAPAGSGSCDGLQNDLLHKKSPSGFAAKKTRSMSYFRRSFCETDNDAIVHMFMNGGSSSNASWDVLPDHHDAIPNDPKNNRTSSSSSSRTASSRLLSVTAGCAASPTINGILSLSYDNDRARRLARRKSSSDADVRNVLVQQRSDLVMNQLLDPSSLAVKDNNWEYKTLLNQDDYDNELSHAGYAILHLFDDSTPEHQATSHVIDSHLTELVPKFGAQCKFLRMNWLLLSPLVVSRLGVTTFPALLPIRNGEVDARVSKVTPSLANVANQGRQGGILLIAFVQLFVGRATDCSGRSSSNNNNNNKSPTKRLTGWTYPAPVSVVDDDAGSDHDGDHDDIAMTTTSKSDGRKKVHDKKKANQTSKCGSRTSAVTTAATTNEEDSKKKVKSEKKADDSKKASKASTLHRSSPATSTSCKKDSKKKANSENKADDSNKVSKTSPITKTKHNSKNETKSSAKSKSKSLSRRSSSPNRRKSSKNSVVAKSQYRTISQNDYNDEFTGSHGFAILHFFDSSKVSAAIDRHLDRLAPTCDTSVKFLRMSGSLAAFIAPKLGVASFPALLALHDGKVAFCLDSVISDHHQGMLSETDLESGAFVEDFVQRMQQQRLAESSNGKKKRTRHAPSRTSSCSGKYRTISQHNDCLADLTGNHGCVIVHFFDTNPLNEKVSTAIDRYLKRQASIHRQTCKFLRISGVLSLFAAPGLAVTNFPEILALQDGVVKARLSNVVRDVSRISDSELQKGEIFRDFVQNFIKEAHPDTGTLSTETTSPPVTPRSSDEVPDLSELYASTPYAEKDLLDALQQFTGLDAPFSSTKLAKKAAVPKKDTTLPSKRLPSRTKSFPSKATTAVSQYREVTQERFYAECSQGCSFVHFYDGSEVTTDKSKALSTSADRYFEEMALIHAASTCTFLRINGSVSPLCVQALGIKEFPAVLALRNGLVQYRFSDVVPEVKGLSAAEMQNGGFLQGFLKEFVLATGYLPNGIISSPRRQNSFRNAYIADRYASA